MSAIEYIPAVFQAGSLGFSARPRSGEDPALLGETICSNVVPNGQAHQNGILVFDCVIAVNGEYTAFLSHEACLSRLSSPLRPMQVIFARPVASIWNRIVRDPMGEIKAGLLEKEATIASIFSKGFQARQFSVTKQSVTYADNGTERKKIGLEDILRVLPTLPNDKENRAFQLVARDKNYDLRAGSLLDKLAWLHSIECAKNRAFDRPLVEPRRQAPPPLPVPPPRPARLPERGIYWLLQRSRISVAGGALPDLSLPPPLVTQLPSLNYDFSLENKVLKR